MPVNGPETIADSKTSQPIASEGRSVRATRDANYSSRSPKGNKFPRRILTRAAQAAVNKKVGTSGLGTKGDLGGDRSIAHRLCRQVWKILPDGVHYIEQGSNPQARKRAGEKRAQALRKPGYAAALTPIAPAPAPGDSGVFSAERLELIP